MSTAWIVPESPAETLRSIAALHDAGDLADPLAAFDEAMDAWRALDASSVHHRPRVVAADPGHEFVTFHWSTKHGPCFECDAPAAWLLWCYGEDRDPAKACAVCACNHAADSGTRVEHIDPDQDED